MHNKKLYNFITISIIHLSRNEEWYENILKNRRLEDSLLSDVVIGPIANDTLYDTFGIIGSGFLAPNEMLSLYLL